LIFPELRAALKGLAKAFDSTPVALDIERKAAGGTISFDTISAGWYARNGYPGLYSILSGGLPAWSGETVSTETAMNHSVVYACQKIIAESVGFIPAVMYRQRGNAKQVAEQHPMYLALKNAPSDEITAQAFSEMLTGHCVLQGNAYAKIQRRSSTGVAIGLDPLQPQQVYPDREKTGQKRLVYVIKTSGEADKTYTVIPGKPHDILHIRGLGWDGIRGYSVITMARQSVGTALATERNVAKFYAGGGRVPYVLEMAQRFKSDADFDRFRSDWEKTYSEPHRAPILENGTTYKQIGLNAADAQLLESRQFTIPEICRWFSVSPHLVGDLSRATFANIEQLALEFVQRTLMAWLTRWEQELWRCVLTPEEKSQGYFWRHNVNALLRGDFQSRMAGYAVMLQNGIASINEVRDMEDKNPIDGGDDHYVQLNLRDVTQPAPQQPTRVRVGATQEQSR
jgi:HK97 family phage portal protein